MSDFKREENEFGRMNLGFYTIKKERTNSSFNLYTGPPDCPTGVSESLKALDVRKFKTVIQSMKIHFSTPGEEPTLRCRMGSMDHQPWSVTDSSKQ